MKKKKKRNNEKREKKKKNVNNTRLPLTCWDALTVTDLLFHTDKKAGSEERGKCQAEMQCRQISSISDRLPPMVGGCTIKA